jgi:hypothetical protein
VGNDRESAADSVQRNRMLLLCHAFPPEQSAVRCQAIYQTKVVLRCGANSEVGSSLGAVRRGRGWLCMSFL